MEIFKDIIAKIPWTTAEELMKIVRDQGRVLVSALPQESVTANVARRILKLIREEYDNVQHRVSRLLTGCHFTTLDNNFNHFLVQATDHGRQPSVLVAAQTGHADQRE